MSRPMDKKRVQQLTWVGSLAVVTLIISVSLSLWRDQSVWQSDVSGPVMTQWANTVSSTTQIEIWSAQDHFTIERGDTGWFMPSRDGYRVRAERIAELDALLGALEYEGARTSDAEKHARLGLADYGSDGAGTRLLLTNASGEALADIILGEMRNGYLYVRLPGEDLTYATQTGNIVSLPLIQTADAWLELDFIALGRTDMARTQITPETGPAYILERPGQSARNFSLRQPSGWRPITAGAGNGPGAALSRIRFRDVRRADRLNGEIIANHTAQTFAGLQISLNIIAQGDTRWAVIEVSALTDGSAEIAAQMDEITSGWAYLLSESSVDRLLRPLDQIADPRE